MEKRLSAGAAIGTWALLFGATLIAYWPALRGGLLWDDDRHLTGPELQSLHGLWRIWFDIGATQQYYPPPTQRLLDRSGRPSGSD
ncbi:MAG: hypothetical protein ACLQVN_05440 [Bryobacteraceae bacterium]